MTITNVVDACALLRDENLVWSADMQDIKGFIADLMIASAAYGEIPLLLADQLAKKILGKNSAGEGRLEFRDA